MLPAYLSRGAPERLPGAARRPASHLGIHASVDLHSWERPLHLSALLEADRVTVEQTDELDLLVEIPPPMAGASEGRQPATLVVVLDRRGSMAADRLEGAPVALRHLVRRLGRRPSGTRRHHGGPRERLPRRAHVMPPLALRDSGPACGLNDGDLASMSVVMERTP